MRAPVHVAVGGEGLAAHGALVGPLAAVHQHVSVQRRGRAQALPTDAAGVVGGARVRVVLRGQETGTRSRSRAGIKGGQRCDVTGGGALFTWRMCMVS